MNSRDLKIKNNKRKLLTFMRKSFQRPLTFKSCYRD